VSVGSAERGRTQLLIRLGTLAGLLALAALQALVHGGRDHPMRALLTPAVFCLLSWFAYCRVYWARGAIVVWLGMNALLLGFAGLLFLRRVPGWGVVMVVIAAAIGYGAYDLYNSEDIEAYLLEPRA
jgi:hypothetical protein